MQSQSTLLPFEDKRFWAKINFDGPTPAHRPELGPCWVWTGYCNADGYGWLHRSSGYWVAHRYLYMQIYGAISDDVEVCHSCDNPPCVNPAHLWPGTHRDNIRDMMMKGRGTLRDPQSPRSFPICMLPGIACGERSGRAVLTEHDVRVIRLRAQRGEPRKDIAVDYPVNPQTIGKIVRRELWRHILD